MGSDKIDYRLASVSFSWHQGDNGKWVQRAATGTLHLGERVVTEQLRLADEQFETETECKAALKSSAELWARAKG